MTDLRTRIIAAIAKADQDWCSDNSLHEDMADAVIHELDMGIPCADSGCRMRQIARKANLKEEAPTLTTDDPNLTLHDTITFAIRDNFSPRVWADADDIAETVIKAVAVYRKSVSEDDFIDSILAGDTSDDMTRLRTYITTLLDEIYFPAKTTPLPSQLSVDAAETLISELNLKAEWGLLNEDDDGVLADTREDLFTLNKHESETIKLRYVTEWEPEHD
jgi:hypothetical protein